jgi:hypothetical protein
VSSPSPHRGRGATFTPEDRCPPARLPSPLPTRSADASNLLLTRICGGQMSLGGRSVHRCVPPGRLAATHGQRSASATTLAVLEEFTYRGRPGAARPRMKAWGPPAAARTALLETISSMRNTGGEAARHTPCEICALRPDLTR